MGKEVSLAKSSAKLLQRLHLGDGFDAFRDEPRVDFRCERDQGRGERTM
jgi:hypothetical protein